MKYDFHDPHEGHYFDLAAWGIEHERERGLPTFNEYLRKYDGKVRLELVTSHFPACSQTKSYL